MADDTGKAIADFLERVLAAMGLAATVTIDETDDALRAEVSGEDVELLVRRRGEGLEALQQVVNAVFRGRVGEDRRIVVDCLNFRRGKDAELREMAKFLVERAKDTGLPQEIGPLNSYSRRIVHLAVSEDPEATSESIGDAAMKTVIISTRRASESRRD